MSAINFPLSSGRQGEPNQVSSQEVAKLPAGKGSQAAALRPDVVTLSEVFPPSQSISGPNPGRFEEVSRSLPELFPPKLPATSPARVGEVQHTTAANTSTLGSVTQQQQLEQLSQTLLALGINPQSISFYNRVSLLQSANDPPALRNLVRALGIIAQPTSQAAAAQTQLTTESPTSPTAQELPAGTASLSFAQSTGTAQLDLGNQGLASTGRTDAQFQQLQLALQSVSGGEGSSASAQAGASDAAGKPPSLNLSA